MKLYEDPISPSARRVRIFLREKKICVPSEKVDIMKGAHLEGEQSKNLPRGQIPVLELDDGSCITETVAISRYFENRIPEPPLFGVDDFDGVIVEMWQRRMEFEVYLPAVQCFRHTNPEFAQFEEQISEWGELSRRRTEAGMKRLDAELKERKFVAGDRYTIADITALCGVDFACVSGLDMPAECKHLAHWHALVSSRPSAQS